MKKCPYCGKEYPDEVTECATDHQPLASFPPAPEPAVEIPRVEEKILTVDIFLTREAAELAVAKLEAYGISCWLKSDDAGAMYPNLAMAGGIRLQVRAVDAERAVALLRAKASPSEISELESLAVASPPIVEQVPKVKFAPIQMLIGISMGIILCLFFQWSQKLGTKTYYYYTPNGQAYEAWVYQNGHLVEMMKDRNHDRKWDEWIHYKYGHIVSAERDNNFDGKPDEWWTYSNGVVVSMEKDADFNGTPDWFCTYKDAILQECDMRPNGAKFTTTRKLYKKGILTEIDRGGDSQGNFKEKMRYDPFFNPTGVEPINTNLAARFNLLP